MAENYDAIVIGGGHNGLVNACYLAKAGLKTLLLEKRHLVGGATITEELLEGFQFTTFSYAVSLLRPDIVEDLDLAKHGLMILPMPNTFQPGYDGEYLLLGADKNANYHEIARHSIEDAEGYRELGHLIDRVCFALKPLMDSIPPNSISDDPEDQARIAELENCKEGLDDDVRSMLDSFLNCSAVEILEQFIESNIVKAMIASSGIIGSQISPRDPKSGLVWLFHKLGEYDGVSGDWGFHKNGNGGLTQVMARAFESLGGTIRLNSAVETVLYDSDDTSGGVSGVRLFDGTEIPASVVVSALDPKRTFTQLVDSNDMPGDLIEAISNYKFQGSASKVNFALSDAPTFPGLEGRTDIFQGFTNVGPSIEYLDAAWEDCQAGRFSRRPFIDCCLQSTVDPDMSPPGKHVLSCFTMYTPYALADSDWDSQREHLGDAVEETLEEFFPGFRELVIHREIVTPLDIERVVGLTEGNIFAGELFMPQMFMNRPAPGWNQYRTPVRGYYQCGSGTHPGGCVTGGPGKLAAKQILGDLAVRAEG
ncbi:phytoene desaturase family protein [Mariniblastus fucicola]|uniref:Pyridine nucleotide-disulfide oxidoreductase domain-containing protein 2 n=1 Tax=Mariniblastus fucicola TaxID=980251 RepID=A0A5B9PBP0_9BACT|nr:NAD(P)/FAD-dependent oxidoreductase [Mariniblastus fucicola]QEG21906.1 Phytoene desaturase (lycopene-forming) [Mariniblastus fucicola]